MHVTKYVKTAQMRLNIKFLPYSISVYDGVIIVTIVNLSLAIGTFPTNFEQSLVHYIFSKNHPYIKNHSITIVEF